MDSRTDLNNPARLPAVIDIPLKEYNPKAQQTWREWIGDKVKWVRNHPVEATVLGVTGGITLVGTIASISTAVMSSKKYCYNTDSKFDNLLKNTDAGKRLNKTINEEGKTTFCYKNIKGVNKTLDFNDLNKQTDHSHYLSAIKSFWKNRYDEYRNDKFKNINISNVAELKNNTDFKYLLNNLMIDSLNKSDALINNYLANDSSYEASVLAADFKQKLHYDTILFLREREFGVNKLKIPQSTGNGDIRWSEAEKVFNEITNYNYKYKEVSCMPTEAPIGVGALAALNTLGFGAMLYKVSRTKEKPRPEPENPTNNEEEQVPLRPRQPRDFEPSPSGELMEFNTSVVKLIKRDAEISAEDQEALNDGSAFSLMPTEGETHEEYRDRLYNTLMQIAVKERNTNGDSKATAITLLSNMYKIRECMNQLSDVFKFGDFAVDAMYQHVDVLFENGALTLDEEQALGGHFCINLVTEYVNGETEMGMLKGFWTSAYHYGEELSHQFINYMLSNNKA